MHLVAELFFLVLPLSSLQNTSLQMDISILVDGSASISFDQYGVLVNFIHDMIDDLTIGPSDTKIQLVTFSTSVSQRLKFKDGVSKATVTNALDNMIKEVRTIILTNLWFDVKGERKERGEDVSSTLYIISYLSLHRIVSHIFFKQLECVFLRG